MTSSYIDDQYDGCIDPAMFHQQAIEQTGTWMDTAETGIDPRLFTQQSPELDMLLTSPQFGSEQYSSPTAQASYHWKSDLLQQRHPVGVVQSTELGAIQGEQGYCASTRYSDTEHQVLMSWDNPSVPQPGSQAEPQPSPSFVSPTLRPCVQCHVPQPSLRPRLQLGTSPSQLTPTSPDYQQALPTSAPAIRVYDTDATLAQHTNDVAPSQFSARRRAVSAPRTMLSHHEQYATAPEFTVDDDLLSPVMNWLGQSQPKVAGQPPTFPGTTLSSPSTPRSRSPSVASSAASSSGGSYPCDHGGCSKSYNTKAKLNHHRRCHTLSHLRPHGCDLCDKRFLFLKELTRHKLIHSNPRYLCSLCGKLFRRADHLRRHGNVHTPRLQPGSPGSTSITESSQWTTGSPTNPNYFADADIDLCTPMSEIDVGEPCASVEGYLPYEMEVDYDLPAQDDGSPPPSPSPSRRGTMAFR